MKVTIKRRTGTTVPRKLELVNVRCVGTSPSHGKGRVIVSQSQAAIQTSPLPMSGGADAPPFWELEDLIGNGFPREAALAVMAARRPVTTLRFHDAAIQPPDIHAPGPLQKPIRHELLTVVLAGA